MSNPFERYAELKVQAKLIEDEMKELNPQVTQAMENEGVDSKETGYGSIKLEEKKNWTYSKRCIKMEEDLKILKAEEQEKKIATCKINHYVKFYANKE